MLVSADTSFTAPLRVGEFVEIDLVGGGEPYSYQVTRPTRQHCWVTNETAGAGGEPSVRVDRWTIVDMRSVDA